MLKAAAEARRRYLISILLGNEDRLAKIAKEENISMEGMEIVNLRHDRELERCRRYAKMLVEKKQREGMTYAEACEKITNTGTVSDDDGCLWRCRYFCYRCI